MTDKVWKVLILGSGPAGLTAALYASRANLQPFLIDGTDAGGQLMITTDVENYPGFPDGILGPQLVLEMRKQAERFGTAFARGEVARVDLTQRPFLVVTDSETTYRCQALIITTGARAKLLGLESEQKLMGHGVSACAVCDGAFFKDQELIAVGGGDTAIEEALFLTKYASKVSVVHRRDTLRASKIMQERAFKNPKIAFIWDSVVDDILDPAADRVVGVRLRNVKTQEVANQACGGVFIAIGHEPNTAPFHGQLTLDEQGYIVTTPGRTETTVPGVFAGGDVQDHHYRQAVTAAGTGCMAAMDAERWLAAQGLA